VERVTEDLAGDRRPPKGLSGENGILATLVSGALTNCTHPREMVILASNSIGDHNRIFLSLE